MNAWKSALPSRTMEHFAQGRPQIKSMSASDSTQAPLNDFFLEPKGNTQVVVEGDNADMPQVETVSQNGVVTRIIITTPSGKQLTLRCEY